jgi:hypothetical protein
MTKHPDLLVIAGGKMDVSLPLHARMDSSLVVTAGTRQLS